MTWQYDPLTGKYTDPKGRVLTDAEVRKIQAETESSHKAELIALAVALLLWRRGNERYSQAAAMTIDEIFDLVPESIRSQVVRRVGSLGGQLSPPAFQIRLQDEIDKSHKVMAVLGAGGFAAASIATWNYAAKRVQSETTYAVRFAAAMNGGTTPPEVEGGTPRDAVTPAQVIVRTSQYAEATYATMSGSIQVARRSAGHIEARRILDPESEHCKPDPDRGLPDCPSLAEDADGNQLDFAPIEQVVPIGETTCGARCRCWINYRRVRDNDESAVAAA